MLNLLNPFWKYICAALSAASLVMGVTVWFQARQIHKWHTQSDKCAAARLVDQQSYKNAQAKAASDNKAQVQQIEQKQQKVSNDVEATYRAQLAQLLADNQRLRTQSPAASGSAGSAGSSAPLESSAGPDGQALPLPPAELLQGQECELQLNALIDLVTQQEAIDPNAGPSH